jgi:hypothetical protein
MASRQMILTWNFIFFIVVSFYSMGAGLVESLVNYPLWEIIGSSGVWIEYHKALGPRIIAVLAVPALLFQLVTNLLLLFFRPVSISRTVVWATLLLLLIAIASSALIQIPIQHQLDAGYSGELVDRLIKSDLLLRVAAGVLRSGFIIYMLYSLFRDLGGPANLSNDHNGDVYKRRSVKKLSYQESIAIL